MKKHFSKIIAGSLMFVVFLMASSFCIPGFFASVVKAKAALAAAPDNQLTSQMANCNDETTSEPASGPVTAGPLIDQNNNYFLPCCLDGSHTAVSTLAPASGLEKSVPALFSAALRLPETSLEATVYHTPAILSPPDLLAVETTILRL